MRRRFFVWGVRRDLNLPEFPQPSTVYVENTMLGISLPNGTQYVSSKRRFNQAPLPSITVGEAISDLPMFDYINPYLRCPEDRPTDPSPTEIPQIAVRSDIVGSMSMPYDKPPRSEFQRMLRENSIVVKNHVTKKYNEENVERICRVPMYPEADHRSLPDPLKPWCLSAKESAASRHNGWKGLYGRLDFSSNFKTSVTDMNPMCKTGVCVSSFYCYYDFRKFYIPIKNVF